jgi:hypothetical protein
MTTRKVYKVKDLSTGLYMGKGGGWDKKGKTWESIGQLKLTLGNCGWWSRSNEKMNDNDLPNSDIKIIEIVIVEDENNMTDLAEIVARQRRYIKLEEKFGSSFRELVERIEAQGQVNQFQWVMIVESSYDYNNKAHKGDIVEMLDMIKHLKLKQNKDYKKASSYFNQQAAIAFASKQVAMQVRLGMKARVQGVDIKDFVETNLDESEKPLLNSST